MEQKEPLKLLPLGVSDYRDLQRDSMYYVDKTNYISVMEQTAKFLFFTRPRRFGKSLFVSMLREYYDIHAQDRYEKNFKGTEIYKNPTPERGKYQIMFFDFSIIDGKFEELEQMFNEYCCSVIEDFAMEYAEYYNERTIQRMQNSNSAVQKLNTLAMEAKRKGNKLYIIVDEYDNFTNSILATKGKTEFEDITHGTGFYRSMIKAFKAKATRSLLIGVSPVTLDDLSSGGNNYTNITARDNFNMALGFSQDEVEAMIRYYQEKGKITRSVESIIEEMKPWYDNYCFAEDMYGVDPTIFNSDMVLYYMSILIESGKSPKDMLDRNARTDYAKMKQIIELDQHYGTSISTIKKIVEQGYIYASIEPSFPAEDIIKPEIFPSLLYYCGMLTIGGSAGDLLKLVIPNRNVMVQYYQYVLEHYQSINHLDIGWLRDSILGAAINGDWRTLFEELARKYKEDTSVRDGSAGEKGVQIFMDACLHFSRLYIVKPEVEMNHGFCDIFLFGDTYRFPDVKHSYIIELKYLKTDATDAEAERQWQEAVGQVKRYGADEDVQKLTAATNLHLIAMQMKGAELLRLEEIS